MIPSLPAVVHWKILRIAFAFCKNCDGQTSTRILTQTDAEDPRIDTAFTFEALTEPR